MANTATVVIHYLFHSGFAVEYGDYLLIFDYYNPPNDKSKKGITKKDLINRIKELKRPFVFVSHSHYDHFNPEIFSWKKYNSSLTYILSNDVRLVDYEREEHRGADYHYMSAYQVIEKHDIIVTTYGSTDIGVSFMVKIGQLGIFYAGDLNWWHWAEESTQQELEEEERKFKEEADRIQEQSIDIMFFPVDPRLGEYYWMGGTYMLEVFKPRLFIPMHFGENSLITQRFAEKMKRHGISIAEISHQGQSIYFSLTEA